MMKEYFKKWRKKSLFSKFTDLLFVALIITLLIPEGRLAVGGFVNSIKSKLSQPGMMDQAISTSDSDWNWSIKDQQGKELLLNDMKGKVLFVNLWATWCPPCVGEMPEIQKMYEKFKDQPDFSIVAISNEDLSTINAFMDKKGYEFPVFAAQGNPTAAFASRSIPTSFLIDKKGNILVKEVGAMNWGGKKMEKMIRDLLNE